jgi:hypothetical protein
MPSTRIHPAQLWNAGRNASQIGLKPVEVAEVVE